LALLSADLEASVGTFQLRAALRVEPGRTLVLFGPSGSGKSLLLRCLAGIHRPVRGRIELDGQVLLDTDRGIDVPPQARRLGYVPQSYALFPHLTVRENVAFGLRRRPEHGGRRRLDELLQAFQLAELMARRPAQLSGGQQQRVALARALAIEPRALLLDEPFAALDAPLRRLLRRELQTLRHRYGFAVILVTHDLGEACALGDQIAVVEQGQIVQAAPPNDVLYRPATPGVARLTGLRNVFPARVTAARDGGLEVATERFSVHTPPYPFEPGAAVDLYVRPEHVVLIRPEHERDPHRTNLVRGRIVDEQHLGPVWTLYFRLGQEADDGGETGGETEGGAGDHSGYDLEVDIAAHPYQALRVSERREWLLSLTPEALHVAPRHDGAAGRSGTP
jgi:molybdate transport system ATP-binding protein